MIWTDLAVALAVFAALFAIEVACAVFGVRS